MLLSVAITATRRTRYAGALGILDGDALEDRMKTILDPRKPLGRSTAVARLCAAVLALALAGRLASASALDVKTEAGPSDMVGRWTGKIPGDGPMAGKRGADLTITLTPNVPDIALTLYRYRRGSDGNAEPYAERLSVVRHGVEKGVLQFRTHTDNFRIRPDDPPAAGIPTGSSRSSARTPGS